MYRLHAIACLRVPLETISSTAPSAFAPPLLWAGYALVISFKLISKSSHVYHPHAIACLRVPLETISSTAPSALHMGWLRTGYFIQTNFKKLPCASIKKIFNIQTTTNDIDDLRLLDNR